MVGLEKDLAYRLVIFPSPHIQLGYIMAMKAAIIVAFLTHFQVSAETVAGTEAEACQSGSIQQLLDSSHAVLEETEAALDTAQTLHTEMFDEDCVTVFGRFLEHDLLNQQTDTGPVQQTKQQIRDYFGGVDPLVWAKPSKAWKTRFLPEHGHR
ncbi:CBWD5 [Symbiodinium sp. CCMP2592]|nr:CBWD5 [Symbiodinium sp. CCMP2592]